MITFRLGLRMTLLTGKEALVRLLMIACAVAVGVTVLLSVLADFHAFAATNSRQCWECSSGSAVTSAGGSDSTNAAKSELWNFSDDYYQGQQIEQLNVAVLGPDAPVIPGLSRMPGPGQYYASPALTALLKTVPADELGDRFPGTQAGTVGDAAMSSPSDLVIVIGNTPQQLSALPATMQVDAISTKTVVNSTKSAYTYGFGLATIALLIPLVVLIGTATRLAAARREERYAAMRLIGTTSTQINVMASVDAAIGALVGTLLGIGGFLAVRSSVAKVAITGSKYFPAVVTPTAKGYVAVLIGVPLIATVGAVWSLRRVRISPLGVGRKVTPPPPRGWRPTVLLVGLLMFVVPVVIAKNKNPNFLIVDVGLVLTMIGLVIGGSWLTMRAAGFVARAARGASPLLAARRLADDPRAAFRSVSGLVMAIFIGTAIAGVVPAAVAGQQQVGGGTLASVLRTSFSSPNSNGLSPATTAQMLTKLSNYPGVRVLPLYSYIPAGTPAGQDADCNAGGDCVTGTLVVDCSSLKLFPALGTCPAGSPDVEAPFSQLMITDNILSLDNSLPLVDSSSHGGSVNLPSLDLGALLVSTDSPATLEQVRTLLTPYAAIAGATSAPQTFGEVAQARADLYNEIQRIALAVVVLTLLVAGCSLAVAVAGGIVERKQPFTLLRLTGTSTFTLYKVALLETAVPLAVAAVVAAGTGLAVAVPIVKELVSSDGSITLPGHVYYLTTGGGLVAAMLVIFATLPLLGRVTQPDVARRE